MTPVDVISFIVAVGAFAVVFFVLFADFKLLNSVANLQSILNLS
jgi:hypothetical protein